MVSTDANDPRSYWVTGAVPSRGVFWAGIGARDLVIGAVTFLIMLLTVFVIPSPPWVTMAVFGVGVVVLVVTRVGTAMGDRVGDVVTRSWKRWLVRVVGVDAHTSGVPLLAGRVRTLEVNATEDHPGMAMFEVMGRGDTPVWYTALVFIHGASRGEGDLPGDEVLAGNFGMFLNRVADQGLPVDQVDVVTRVCPDGLEAYRAANQAMWTGPVEAVTAMETLVDDMWQAGSVVTSWLVIRMPEKLLRNADTAGSLVEVAHDTVDRVIALADIHGLEPRANGTPRRVGAMLRNLYDPDCPVDDLTGVSGVWDGMGAWQTTRVGVVTESWVHSVGVVDRDGWPWFPVHADMLDPLVVSPGNQTPVTIMVQFPLVPRVAALKKARTATVTALGAQYENEKQGRVSTGEESDQSSAAALALDTIRHGSAGVAPVIRVMVSAWDVKALRRAREDVRTRFLMSGFSSLSWCDGDQARQMACVWPLGRGVKSPS